jgi:hypothetical protein
MKTFENHDYRNNGEEMTQLDSMIEMIWEGDPLKNPFEESATATWVNAIGKNISSEEVAPWTNVSIPSAIENGRYFIKREKEGEGEELIKAVLIINGVVNNKEEGDFVKEFNQLKQNITSLSNPFDKDATVEIINVIGGWVGEDKVGKWAFLNFPQEKDPGIYLIKRSADEEKDKVGRYLHRKRTD